LQGLYDDFVAFSPSTRDRISGVTYPFEASGAGMDVAAAHALISACLDMPENAMLDALGGAIDWLTWKTWPASKNAAALGSLAGFFEADPRRAALGGMLEAGLVADKAAVPLDSLLKALYRRFPEGMPLDRYAAALTSPIRLISGADATALSVQGGYQISADPGSLIAALAGMSMGSDLKPSGDVGPGWIKLEMKERSAMIPTTATPLPLTPTIPIWKLP
jgi:hypothetical protein